MVSELLRKYIWLIQTFVRVGQRGLDLKEICERWENRFGTPYSRRSFNNHRLAVEDLFGVIIECDRSTNRYFIGSSDSLADEDDTVSWLINTFTINEMLTLSKERLSGRVSVEDIPSGQKHLTQIMDAMTENRVLEVLYHKYTGDSGNLYTLYPYAIKENAKRWYLIAFCLQRNSVRIYSLDRIKEITPTEERFTMPRNFDVEELFATNYGVYLSEEKPVEIVFRTTSLEAKYMRDLPVHRSQKEKGTDGDKVTFSIFVRPNPALLMELARLGASVEVLSPAPVREAVARKAAAAAALYSKDGCPETSAGPEEPPSGK